MFGDLQKVLQEPQYYCLREINYFFFCTTKLEYLQEIFLINKIFTFLTPASLDHQSKNRNKIIEIRKSLFGKNRTEEQRDCPLNSLLQDVRQVNSTDMQQYMHKVVNYILVECGQILWQPPIQNTLITKCDNSA